MIVWPAAKSLSSRHRAKIIPATVRCGRHEKRDEAAQTERLTGLVRIGSASPADHHLQLLELSSALSEHHSDVLVVGHVAHHVDLPTSVRTNLLTSLRIQTLGGTQHIAVERSNLSAKHELLQ